MSPAPTDKVTRYRSRLRASGMRPIQIWVPDTRNSDFVIRVKKQCIALSSDREELDVLHFTEAAASETEGWK